MKFISTLIIWSICIIPSLGQYVEGKVFEILNEKKISLEGANIIWAGTTNGTTTDSQGFFRIKKIKSISELIISYVGYHSDTVLINKNETNIEVILKGAKELEEIKVVGNNGSYFDQTKPINTQNITQSELKKCACCNLSESFETNASVDVDNTDAVSGAKQIKLLGLAGKYTQIMKENIPGIRGLASTYGLNYIPGPWMESIQISKGTASVVNGYESITGQINIEIKKPKPKEAVHIDWYQNSLFKTEMNANYSTRVSDKLTTLILGHGEYSYKGVDKNSDSFYDLPKIKQVNLLNRWIYSDGENLSAQLGISFLNETREAGQLSFDDNMQRLRTNSYGISVNTERYELFTKTGYIFRNLDNASLGWVNKIVVHNQDSYFGLKNYTGKEFSFYTNLIYSTIIVSDVHKVSMGGSFVFDKYEEQLDLINLDRKENIPGLFFEYTYTPNPDLVFMAGIRADFHNKFGEFYTPRFHLKYNITDRSILRLSVGKGYRSANLIAENSELLASSRSFVFLSDLDQEEVWNYGLSISQYLKLFEKELTINIDLHRTEFISQVVVDQDTDPDNIFIYNLNGEAYSNNYQIEITYSPINRLNMLFAFRVSDVKTTIKKQLVEIPLNSKIKSLLSFSYISSKKLWQYDLTFQYNGSGRIPDRHKASLGEKYNPFLIVNGQITRVFQDYEIYFGAENLLGYTQENPIISAEDPFNSKFDASTVWAPINGAKFYIGIRYAF